ncbi:MAG TPA: rod-binding protein [Devosiaceae bacterium]|nr:rod-binding protein [Devosiaceae bacterium]
MQVQPALGVSPPAPPASAEFEAARRHAVQLEGLFLNTLLSEMLSSAQTDGPFGGGFAEETWRGMMAEQYATAFAEAGGIGLANAILSDLIANQATTPAAPDPQHAAGAYAR